MVEGSILKSREAEKEEGRGWFPYKLPRWQRGILCVFYMDFCTHPPPLKSFILTAAMPQPPTCLDLSIIYTWAVMHLNFRKIKVDISAAFLTDRMEKGGELQQTNGRE